MQLSCSMIKMQIGEQCIYTRYHDIYIFNSPAL